jgi:hypothetical protein
MIPCKCSKADSPATDSRCAFSCTCIRYMKRLCADEPQRMTTYVTWTKALNQFHCGPGNRDVPSGNGGAMEGWQFGQDASLHLHLQLAHTFRLIIRIRELSAHCPPRR